jgi:predicted DsbA family dithiol-disulfide isomerase
MGAFACAPNAVVAGASIAVVAVFVLEIICPCCFIATARIAATLYETAKIIVA